MEKEINLFRKVKLYQVIQTDWEGKQRVNKNIYFKQNIDIKSIISLYFPTDPRDLLCAYGGWFPGGSLPWPSHHSA